MMENNPAISSPGISDLIQQRRSVRKYRNEPVPTDLLHELLADAVWAPSACNKQDWRFIIIGDKEKMQQIIDAGGAIIIKNAPQGILVTYRESTRNAYYRDDVQSACACIQNFLLLAAARHISTCWICHLPNKGFLRKLFNIPPSFQPIAYIMLGYAAGNTFAAVHRKHDITDIVGLNTFKDQTGETGKEKWKLFERLFANAYRRAPVFIKKAFLNRILDKKFVRKFEN